MILFKKFLLFISTLTFLVAIFLNQNIYANEETTYKNDTSTYEVTIPAYVSFNDNQESTLNITGKVSKLHELTISVNSENDFNLKNGNQLISYTVKDGNNEVTQNTSWSFPTGNDLSKYENESEFSKTLDLKLNETGSTNGTYSDQLVFTFTDKECYEVTVMPYVMDNPSESMIDINFDVYVNDQLAGNETWFFDHFVPLGSTYEVKNIKLTTDEYTYKGEESYTGTVHENTTININVQNKYKTISFDANGGSCSMTSKKVEYGGVYGELPTPTYSDTGVEFKGWYKADGTLVQETDICTSNITLYAHWSNVATYKMVSGFDFWTKLDKDVTSIVFTYIDAPKDKDVIDLSANGDQSVVGWLDGTTYYVSTQNQYKKVIFNENSAQMFYLHQDITSFDFSNIDTSLVTDMTNMFSATGVESLDLSNFDTSNVKSMTGMFNYCSNLKSLDLSNFNTEKVTAMHAMFEGSSSLKSIQFSENFNTKNVTDMEDMFQDCSSLETLDLTSFDMSNVLYVMEMFKNDKKLNAIYATSKFDLKNVTSGYNDYYMFENCESLPNFNSSSVNKYQAKPVIDGGYIYMDVRTVTFNANGGTSTQSSWQVENGHKYGLYGDLPTAEKEGYTFGGWYTEQDGGTKVTSDTLIDSDSDITIYARWIGTSYKLTTGSLFNSKIPDSVKKVVFTDTAVPDDAVITDLSIAHDYSVLGYLGVNSEDQTTWYVTTGVSNQKVIFNEDSSSMFDESLTTIKHRLEYIEFNDNIDTSLVTNMNAMFKVCSSLKEVDVTKLNTVSVLDTSYMFAGCEDLTSLDFTYFNTSKVENMEYMFTRCIGLTSLSVSNFDTSSVTNMSYMFAACSKLTNLDVANFNTSKVTNMSNMFISCNGLTTLDLSSFDMSNVTTLEDMFRECNQLGIVYAREESDIEKFNTATNTPEGVTFSLKETNSSEEN